MNRRDFIKAGASLAAVGAMPELVKAGQLPKDFKWSMLVHFGMKWCGDLPRPRAVGGGKPTGTICGNLTQEEYDLSCTPEYWEMDHIRFDETLWREYSEALRADGCNELVIDLCEFVRFPSHPELAVKGTWSVAQFTKELDRLRAMGFKVVPKLNFSCTHNGWMGEYKFMVGSRAYYRFCQDIVRDAVHIFGGPEMFHLGLDEEQLKFQTKDCSVMVVRSPKVWWRDINFLFDEVRKNGARPWVWADSIREHDEEFVKNVPKDVVCSEWTYYIDSHLWRPEPENRDKDKKSNENRIKSFTKHAARLEQGGFTQMIGGSHCYGSSQGCFDQIQWGLDTLPPEHFRGFLMTTWMPVQPAFRRLLLKGAGVIGDLRKKFVV